MRAKVYIGLTADRRPDVLLSRKIHVARSFCTAAGRDLFDLITDRDRRYADRIIRNARIRTTDRDDRTAFDRQTIRLNAGTHTGVIAHARAKQKTGAVDRKVSRNSKSRIVPYTDIVVSL